MIQKLKELDVVVVAADISDNFGKYSDAIKKDLARAEGRVTIPVNMIYPPNYPAEPAILLEELISPADALEALSRVARSSALAVTTKTPDTNGDSGDIEVKKELARLKKPRETAEF